MSDTHPVCVLCCCIICFGTGPTAWMGEFRAVRCIIGDPFLTGVGVFMRRGETLVAPCDENKRYDDYGYRASERDEFSSMCTLHDDSKTGYVFHESCWKLLKTLLYPSPVPIQTLYNICRSCPIPNPGYVELGLDYWGLAKKNPALPYPWEGFHILRRLIPEQGRRNIMGWKCDPFDIPELQSLLDETQQQAQQEETKASVSPSFKKQPDCFSSLPPELLDEIRILLPSADVVNLHLASRSFASLPLSQYFWASRFRQRFERSHIFEPTIPDYDAQGRKCRRDWKRLYKKTARSYSPSTKLENRARVWNCASLLADLLVEIPPVDDTAIEGFQGVDTGARQWEAIPGWKWVGGDFRPQSPDLPSAGDFRPPRSPDLPSSMACNIRFDQNVVVPEDLVQIGVSLLYFHNRQYISGLRLISRGKRDVQLGYKLPKKEVILDLKSQDGDQNILTGFVCALGARGIHGLRVVTSGGQLSEWAGCTSVLPQTLRLRVEQPISRIKAAFDGFKMVGLAVPDVPSPNAATDETEQILPLRSNAIWYPDIPPESVCLHGDSYSGKVVSSTEYRPVIHSIFGGSRGIYLKYLTQISALCSRSAIVGLEFSYRGRGSPIRHKQLHCLINPEHLNKINFNINGPTGELITRVQVGYGYRRSKNTISGPQQQVDITTLTLETNQDRKFIFSPGVIPKLGPLGKTIRISQGRTITGLYGIEDPLSGMSDLGAISELLPPNEETQGEDSKETTEKISKGSKE